MCQTIEKYIFFRAANNHRHMRKQFFRCHFLVVWSLRKGLSLQKRGCDLWTKSLFQGQSRSEMKQPSFQQYFASPSQQLSVKYLHFREKFINIAHWSRSNISEILFKSLSRKGNTNYERGSRKRQRPAESFIAIFYSQGKSLIR